MAKVHAFEIVPQERISDNNGNENLWEDQDRAQVSRSIPVRQITLIKKIKLSSYSELARFQMGDDTTIFHNCGLTEKELEPSQVTCAICQENIQIGEWYKKLPKCEHCFHASCIDQWLLTRATCPVCRDEIFIE